MLVKIGNINLLVAFRFDNKLWVISMSMVKIFFMGCFLSKIPDNAERDRQFPERIRCRFLSTGHRS